MEGHREGPPWREGPARWGVKTVLEEGDPARAWPWRPVPGITERNTVGAEVTDVVTGLGDRL